MAELRGKIPAVNRNGYGIRKSRRLRIRWSEVVRLIDIYGITEALTLVTARNVDAYRLLIRVCEEFFLGKVVAEVPGTVE